MKRQTVNKRRSNADSAPEHAPIPTLRVRKGASRKEIYAAARRAFTAADLQKYTEFEEGIPFEQIIADLEAIQKAETRNAKRRKKKT
jgi:hypothetical protein